MNKKQKFLDIKSKNNQFFFDSGLNKSSILFSRGKKSFQFFTEDSKLYITPNEARQIRDGIKLDREIKKWDSLSCRIVERYERYSPKEKGRLIELLEERYETLSQQTASVSQNFLGQFSMVRLWNLSIVGSILFGMVTMTFVYRYLGQGAAAGIKQDSSENTVIEKKIEPFEIQQNSVTFSQEVAAIDEANKQKQLEDEIRSLVKGYPIESMAPYIASKDRTVAAFLVGIAKKESGWGKHRPVLNGQNCYNYWGYRGIRKLMGSGGHTCFNSPKDAVDTVARRIEFLVEKEKRDTPQEMVIWKCGSDCKSDSGAKKWILDVERYFNKIEKNEKPA